MNIQHKYRWFSPSREDTTEHRPGDWTAPPLL